MASFEAFHYRQFHQALNLPISEVLCFANMYMTLRFNHQSIGENSQIIGVRLKVGYDIYRYLYLNYNED